MFYLTKALEIEPTNVDFLVGRAIVYVDEMRMDSACRDFQKACSLGEVSACAALEEKNCVSWKRVWDTIK